MVSQYPTVLVTGAAGFIGAAVAEALMARGQPVIGIDSMNDYYQVSLKEARRDRLVARFGNLFTFHTLDFADMEATQAALAPHDFGLIVHLGAQAGVRYSLENPQAYVASNLAGHVNMLEIARARQVGHMVYASSSSVYGGNEKLPFAVEDRADHPVSLYAATKKADELMSETYAHLFRIPLTGLRFFTVYGPWGRPDMAMWKFTERMLSGRPIDVYNHGEMQRDFTYIDDIVGGVLACLDRPPVDDGREKAGGSVKPHALYNIGNNRSERLMRLIEVLEDACGVKAELNLLPMQPGDVPATYANIDALTRDTGYAPTTPIEIGVPRFVEWYRGYLDV
ncbi:MULTISPECIES: SDR family NAD(P)-dependent oxidoreductase [Novosphingobium]|uniref:UDP-glucuronate 5'-epimerase n=1 Tax=Novosphingobium pentaromativorans US6-1 TaxID=1088721 RepID=G6E9R1_9SPHN|nr:MULTISPECIES: SDR family NAD(P)-dependent oxidoreductase [Novosphingobium]AIT80939.1 protein CapI [Novosphingobium pentaromativorans US6-1]EHJ61985.1 UDP-glucuronate 5'-epimerase [Novosphingobium pentaromativorans US6-1]CCA91742.1 UDP-glucuronate 5'-epimerase [Novosphingobium sp. PP1Y]